MSDTDEELGVGLLYAFCFAAFVGACVTFYAAWSLPMYLGAALAVALVALAAAVFLRLERRTAAVFIVILGASAAVAVGVNMESYLSRGAHKDSAQDERQPPMAPQELPGSSGPLQVDEHHAQTTSDPAPAKPPTPDSLCNLVGEYLDALLLDGQGFARDQDLDGMWCTRYNASNLSGCKNNCKCTSEAGGALCSFPVGGTASALHAPDPRRKIRFRINIAQTVEEYTVQQTAGTLEGACATPIYEENGLLRAGKQTCDSGLVCRRQDKGSSLCYQQ